MAEIVNESQIDQREAGGINVLTQPIEADSEYERLHKFLIKFFPGKKREVLLNKPVGQKLKEMLFFIRRQKIESVAIAAQGENAIYNLLEILDDNFLAPSLHLLWGRGGKNLDVKNSLLLVKEHVQEHGLNQVEKILPLFVPRPEMKRDQKRMASFLLNLKPMMSKVRFLLLTDEDIRLLVTSDYKLLRKKNNINEAYVNSWKSIVESPSMEIGGDNIEAQNKSEKDTKGSSLEKRELNKKPAISFNYPVPFTNFYDDAFLLQGQVMKPGDIHSAREFNADVHVTITGILGRMGLHRQHLTKKVEYEGLSDVEIAKESKANFLFYSLYYAHLSYIISNRNIPKSINLIEEGHQKLADTSPVPVRIFIIARLVAKYHLPVHVLFSMIETLEDAYAKFHAAGAKERFKKILKMALAMAKVGRKRGDYSLVLGRTYLFETERAYLTARAKLKRAASEDEALKETLHEDEKALSKQFQQAAMQKYMDNLAILIKDDQAAFDFFINGKLVKRFARIYPSFPPLYAEWLVSEFAELSSKLDKKIHEVSKENFIELGILPAYILTELGVTNTFKKDHDPYKNVQDFNVLEDAKGVLEEEVLDVDEIDEIEELEDLDSGILSLDEVDLSLDEKKEIDAGNLLTQDSSSLATIDENRANLPGEPDSKRAKAPKKVPAARNDLLSNIELD